VDPRALPDLRVLHAAVLQYRAPPAAAYQETSSIGQWRARVEGLTSKGLQPMAIHTRLRLEESGFAGSYWAVKRLYRAIRRARVVSLEDVANPVVTRPGEVAQVDFGYVGRCLRQSRSPRCGSDASKAFSSRP
jgi:hypothetical protein